MALNKYTATYRCSSEIENLKIRVKLKEIRPTISIPSDESPVKETESNFFQEERDFLWQQKVFSQFEASYYGNQSNCVSDLAKKYNELLSNEESHYEGRFFTYINEDDYLDVNQDTFFMVDNLKLNFNKLKIKNEPEYQTMCIMADMSYADNGSNDSENIKKEVLLCKLQWNNEINTLIVYPDFSQNQSDPYVIETGNGRRNSFHYWIYNASSSENELTQEIQLMHNVNEKQFKYRKQQKITDFYLPLKNDIVAYVFLEILEANNFDCNNLYIEYFIDLPRYWTTPNIEDFCPYGTTHCVKTLGPDNIAYIGFPLEMEFIKRYNISNDNESNKLPTIYFELISKNLWSRYRTEGFTYLKIPVNKAGIYSQTLSCFLVQPKSPRGDLERFFIGGYSNLDDITWLNIPTGHNESVLNKIGPVTTSTGGIKIKMSIVRQSKMFLNKKANKEISDKNGLTQCMKSFEEVLLAFQKARENMKKAREELRD